MRYLAMVGSTGPQPPEAIAEMGRDFPAYLAEMEPRGVRSIGRELALPSTAVTIRVREGETLITDGPFAETKEYLAGFDLLNCADLDEAIEIEGKSPVARFCPFEIRPLPDAFRVGARTAGFGEGEDGDSIPYMLVAWARAAMTEETVPDVRAHASWQERAEAAGIFILGGELAPPTAAVTLRFRDGRVEPVPGPFLDTGDSVRAIDVVSCRSHDEAVTLAVTHPLTAIATLEVRPFYVG